jgi:hypothetical protein
MSGANAAGRRPPTPEEMAFVAGHRIARLATTGPDGAPAIVRGWLAAIAMDGAAAIVTPLED